MSSTAILRYTLLILIIVATTSRLFGQNNVDSTKSSRLIGLISLDSVVVVAARYQFDVEDFIEFVLDDESFYQAFRQLRRVDYQASAEMSFYNRKGKQKAHRSLHFSQEYEKECPVLQINESGVDGNLYRKNKDHRYLTAELFDHLFLRPGPCISSIPNEKNTGNKISTQVRNGANNHSSQLRQLIFEPGKEADIPFMGNKLDIFSDEMQAFYDYVIMYDTIHSADGQVHDTYLFRVNVKPEFMTRKTGKTVIKSLDTWFDIENRQVLRRIYEMDYDPLMISAQARIKMEITRIGEKYLPFSLSYRGTWNIPFKRRETGTFHVKFKYK